MDFNAQQMREDSLIKEGRYKFTVLDGREKTSTNGNNMLNLKLSLQVNNRRVTFYDSLIFMPKMFWKVEHFCKAAGMPEKIDEGKLLPEDCMGREGYIDIVQQLDNQSGELVNRAKDYVKPEDVVETQTLLDDDISL